LSKRKGHKVLIEAIAKLIADFPNLVCRIIGEGPERPKLIELIDRLKLNNVVELRGRRPHAEVIGDMSWCDIFVLASYGEASGTVYGEAMQFNKPVIACTGEGIAEVVRDKVHGRLVPAGDVSALAEAVGWLLKDDDRRKAIGLEANVLANTDLSYPHMARRLISLYGDLVTAAQHRNTAASAAKR